MLSFIALVVWSFVDGCAAVSIVGPLHICGFCKVNVIVAKILCLSPIKDVLSHFKTVCGLLTALTGLLWSIFLEKFTERNSKAMCFGSIARSQLMLGTKEADEGVYFKGTLNIFDFVSNSTRMLLSLKNLSVESKVIQGINFTEAAENAKNGPDRFLNGFKIQDYPNIDWPKEFDSLP